MKEAILKYAFPVLLCFVTFFVHRSAFPVVTSEARNMVIAHEMVTDGHWLIPHMNGEPRLATPPFPLWVSGCIEAVWPGSVSAQRTANGLMGCLLTVYLFLLVRYASHRTDFALASVLVFLTCYNLVYMGRTSSADIYGNALMMAAIYYLTRALYEKHHYAQWLALAGLFMGLSFLSEGPVAFYALLLPYFIMLIALPSPTMRGKWRSFLAMAAIATVVAGWWYVALLTLHPESVGTIAHKLAVFWHTGTVRPWYYYWRFFLEMGAWAMPMLVALWIPYWKRHITMKREYLMSITWALASLVLLSFLPGKKMAWLLPSLAPCSVVVGCLLMHFKDTLQAHAGTADERRAARKLFTLQGIIIIVAMLATPVALIEFGWRSGSMSLRTQIAASAAMLAVAAWTIRATMKRRPLLQASGVALSFMAAEFFMLPTISDAVGNPHEHSIELTRKDARLDGIPFYHNEKEFLRIELVYDAGKKIRPLDLSDTRAVLSKLPCAIVTRKPASAELPAELLQQVDTTAIGYFDDNKHRPSNSHYTKNFLNYVTLLRSRKTQNPAK